MFKNVLSELLKCFILRVNSQKMCALLFNQYTRLSSGAWDLLRLTKKYLDQYVCTYNGTDYLAFMYGRRRLVQEVPINTKKFCV